MIEAAPPDVKRRRLSAANGYPHIIRRLTDLPSGILAHAAGFIAAPSRAFFAASLAINQNASAASDERNIAIVDHEWSTLDFGDIEKDLVARLTDDDISAILMSIDAANKLKRLKSTNCTNITGVGLRPLRGSLVIEQIDLSLVGDNQNPDLDPEPPISCNHVLPILDSIIAREGCALMHLQFPSVWWKEPSLVDSEFHAFIVRYNEMRDNRGTVRCLECNENLPEHGLEWIETATESHNYGRHYHTCYECLKQYCYDCDGDNLLYECGTCGRDYCRDCRDIQAYCTPCMKFICNDCHMCVCNLCNGDLICLKCVKEGYEVKKCDRCNKCYCRGCVENYYYDDDEAVVAFICGGCNKGFCSECAKKDSLVDKCECCDAYYCRGCYYEGVGIFTCEECDIKCCDDCRLHKFRQGHQNCKGCINEIAHLLVDESAVQKQLREENEQLKVENGKLKREIEEMKLERTRS